MPSTPTFLSAQWRDLALFNYRIDPALLTPYLPAGTELDYFNGQSYVSMVGFRFLDTKILGMPMPFHVNFEEVNLRFYVRHRAADGIRRGVVFVKEIVPRSAIAHTARIFYNEPYVALPMSHRIHTAGAETTTRYEWRFRGRANHMEIVTAGEAQVIADDTEVAFITEHYWGYNRQRDGGTMEYEVQHERWQFRPALRCELDCDAAGLYGPQFEPVLAGPPASAFLATGAPVTVAQGRRLGAVAAPRQK